MDDVERALQFHQRFFGRTGVWLTLPQLESRSRVRLGPRERIEVYSRLRSGHPSGARFSRQDGRRRAFQTLSPLRPGVYFIDYAEFHKSWAWHNDRATGFLVAVENLTNRLFVLPSKGKSTRSWLDSVARFVELTRNVAVINSDRDSVATSPRFAAEMEDKYGLHWCFLPKGNKSYLAERYVGLVKTKLSQALEAKGGKRWVDLVGPLVREYNSQKVPGTSYTRQGVDRSNFESFASQLLGERDLAGRQSGFKAGPFRHHPEWNRAVFSLEIGDRVLVARSANWKFRSSREDGEGKKTVFDKPSTSGSFGKRVFTVAGRQLRANRAFDRMIPVYSLREFGARHLHFYENELRRVDYSPPTEGRS